MGCRVIARLKNGLPTLEIQHAKTGQPLLQWAYEAESNLSDKKQLQELFRELLLVSMRQERTESEGIVGVK